MRESVCAFQEAIYANEASLFEMTSRNLSSIFCASFSIRDPEAATERQSAKKKATAQRDGDGEGLGDCASR